MFAQNLHPTEAISNLRMRFCCFAVHFKSLSINGLFFNFCREIFQKLILHPVLLALVICFQHLQPCHINIQIHLFLNQRIPGTQSFDLRIGQRLFIYIITGTDRRFRCHNLRDKFLFILQSLIEIGIKGSFCDILVNLHFLIAIALADDTPVSLCHIRRTPAHVQMVERNQPILTVCPGSHFLRTAKQYTHLTGTNLRKQFFFLRF